MVILHIYIHIPNYQTRRPPDNAVVTSADEGYPASKTWQTKRRKILNTGIGKQ